VLKQSQVEWTIRAESRRRMTNEEIADAQGVSISGVQRLCREYGRSGTPPILKKAGRHVSTRVAESDVLLGTGPSGEM
jgi:transposase